MTSEPLDVAIVGAGPAGMAAAIALRARGMSVAVFDEQPSPGGQIYRNVLKAGRDRRAAILGPDYVAGLDLAERFMACGADYKSRATVWRIGEDGLSWSSPQGGGDCAARRVLVATGAMERPFPVEGWTLPGVMTAGAAQILIKTSGAVADDAVFIGCGPLLYLVVYQYLQAGVRVRALLDTAEPGNRIKAALHLPGAIAAPSYLVKGVKLLAAIRRAGIAVHRNVSSVALVGEGRLSAVRWTDASGSHELSCERAFLHQGIVPNANITMAARCAHRWNERQLSWQPVIDGSGRTNLDWLSIAGDLGGIGGARAAELSGEIAAVAIANDFGRGAGRDHAAPRLRRARELLVRPFLDVLYRPRDGMRQPRLDDVIICRCEEVRRRDVAAAAAQGCPGPNQLKAFTRAGMGPCQGRLCGLTVGETLAGLREETPAQAGYFRIRMPIKPVTVGDIAGLSTTQGDQGS
ncbi:FAD-dependent oxidoreductase [Pseudolabrys sp. FHR47]|uniref:FAD-dependent oxidoreductase n=1 Tax=Pseudolabrys sp. FHR47 TaxID=2562284 RepID=UPI0010BE6CB4|nr:FAD-dependent oxidoreductase [Pseudolabrys sp. FHR47]